MPSRSTICWVALFALLALVPLAVSSAYYLHLLVVIAIYAIVLLGMDLLVGYTGQVSLGHAAFFGIGAYTAGLLMMKLQLPFPLALLAAIALAAVFGLVLAAAALRVSGPYLAMVTLAFATIVQILINEMDWLTLGPIGLPVDKPRWMGAKMGTHAYYYVVLGVLALVLVCIARWANSYVGRAFEALRDSPVATECMGISVRRLKAAAFAVSAAAAGLGGALYAVSEEYTSPNTYSFELSILFLLGTIFGGRKSRAGALVGATVVVLLPTLLDSLVAFRWLAGSVFSGVAAATLWQARRAGRAGALRLAVPLLVTGGLLVFSLQVQNLNEHRLTVFGLLILLVVFYLPNGVLGLLPRGARATAQRRDLVLEEPRGGAPRAGAMPLHVRGVTMQFGGLTALRNVDIDVAPGTIHGLIGPNGSGKSTMMNVLTGVYVPTAGRVEFAQRNIQGRSSSEIAQAGIARTFQNVQLFWEMTVLENVMVGLHRDFSDGLLGLALRTRGSRQREAAAEARALQLLDLVGLRDVAHVEARDLPYGRQRLLEIARALALSPSVLLLDEPAAGLTAPDVADLVEVLRKIKAQGVTMVLIEHHVDMVMQLCDQVTVLDFGEKIAEGTASAVRANPRVISAYLGSTA